MEVVSWDSDEAQAKPVASSKIIVLKKNFVNREPIKKKVLFRYPVIGLAHIWGKMRLALLVLLDLVVHHHPIPELD